MLLARGRFQTFILAPRPLTQDRTDHPSLFPLLTCESWSNSESTAPRTPHALVIQPSALQCGRAKPTLWTQRSRPSPALHTQRGGLQPTDSTPPWSQLSTFSLPSSQVVSSN